MLDPSVRGYVFKDDMLIYLFQSGYLKLLLLTLQNFFKHSNAKQQSVWHVNVPSLISHACHSVYATESVSSNWLFVWNKFLHHFLQVDMKIIKNREIWFVDLYLRGWEEGGGGVRRCWIIEIPWNFSRFPSSPNMKSSNYQYQPEIYRILYWLPTIYAKNTETPTILYASNLLKNFLLCFLAASFNMWTELYDIF